MKIKANLMCKPSNFQMDDCQIEKVVELSHAEFCRLRVAPLEDQPFIAENKSCMYSQDGVPHCLLALGEGSNDGVLIEAEGYDYARYAAYIPGMRDIVNAEINRAAEYIVQQGTEKSMSASWCVRFEDLAGLNIQEGNGLDSMLRAALKSRPEVAAVDMHDGYIEMEFHPEYCKQLNKEAAPGLRVKDLLPLLKGNGLMFLCHEEAEQSVLVENLRLLTDAGQEEHAAILNARITEIYETPEATELVLTGVEPEELVRFNEAYDAFMEAEQSMGPTMG